VLKYARELGSYLYYDDSRIYFEGNIKGKSYYFQRNILRLFQNSGENGGLIVAVEAPVFSAISRYVQCFFSMDATSYL
jgi:hypothetical protein